MSKHTADGSGLQEHSVGELYPFIVLKRGDEWGWSNAVLRWAQFGYSTARAAEYGARLVRDSVRMLEYAGMAYSSVSRREAYRVLWNLPVEPEAWRSLEKVVRTWKTPKQTSRNVPRAVYRITTNVFGGSEHPYSYWSERLPTSIELSKGLITGIVKYVPEHTQPSAKRCGNNTGE